MFIYIFLVLIVIVLAWLAITRWLNFWEKNQHNIRHTTWLAGRNNVLITIQVPRLNEKTPLAAEQMFASIHGIFQANAEFQEHISFEIMAKGNSIRFYVYLPEHLKDYVESQIYAQYPSVEIKEVEDYTRDVDLDSDHMVGVELRMTKEDVYPIKTFLNFTVDPLAGITSALAKLNDNEQVWIQLVMRPLGDEWQKAGIELVEKIKKGSPKQISIPAGIAKEAATIVYHTAKEAVQTGSSAPSDKKDEKKDKEAPKLSSPVESALKGIEEKITKLGYEANIRIMSVGKDLYAAQSKASGVVGAFKQFNTTNLNSFVAAQSLADNHDFWNDYAARNFKKPAAIFNIEELASLYHLPNETVETPNIVWTNAKKGEPPSNLPLSESMPANMMTVLGKTNFRNVEKDFGITTKDRARHVYIIGKSGTGKSTLMENMIIDDIREGRGVILVDPHGELFEHIIACVPKERVDDVIVFDPSDKQNPVGFNLLEKIDDDLKGIIASGFVGIFEKMFSNSWGPRLEHILRNTVLALLDYPGSTMLSIPRMLTDKKLRDLVVKEVKDPVIRDFWENEFASWDQKFASEAVAPILNKVGQFLAASTIRNIVSQEKSTFDIRKIMDEGKILLINLSRGKIGEDNSAMLGAMLVTKVQLSAMSRADIAAEKRTDCYFYVDEFQNFATRSFATILSEARKYHLSLTMANQYIAQVSEEVRDAVFGNVGTMISFRVGAADASALVKEYEPVFSETDMVNQDIHKIYLKLSIDGTTSPAFSASSLPPIKANEDYTEEIINLSRQKYSRPRVEVEYDIEQWSKIGEVRKDPLPMNLAAIADKGIELPSIKIKPENIVEGIYYKEIDTKGGVRWWEGYPLEQVMEEEEKKRQKFIVKKIEHLKSATSASGYNSQVEGQSDNILSDTNKESKYESEDDQTNLVLQNFDSKDKAGESIKEKIDNQQGTNLGETTQGSYSTKNAGNSEPKPGLGPVGAISHNNQNKQELTVSDKADHSIIKQAQFEQNHALALPSDDKIAEKSIVLSSSGAQKPPESPRIDDSISSNTNSGSNSIIDRVMASKATDADSNEDDETLPKSNKVDGSELKEGEQYTFDQ
jgi:hypothetical protein